MTEGHGIFPDESGLVEGSDLGTRTWTLRSSNTSKKGLLLNAADEDLNPTKFSLERHKGLCP